jgi:hypothetical protein
VVEYVYSMLPRPRKKVDLAFKLCHVKMVVLDRGPHLQRPQAYDLIFCVRILPSIPTIARVLAHPLRRTRPTRTAAPGFLFSLPCGAEAKAAGFKLERAGVSADGAERLLFRERH